MIVRQTFRVIGLILATLHCAALAGENTPSPPSDICASHADWVDDDPEETARAFGEAFREFDRHFTAFSARFAEAFESEAYLPDPATISGLHTGIVELYLTLAQFIPMRDAGNEAWPLKFLEEEMSSGISLPDFDPPDRQEVLRAAFLREIVSVPLAEPEGAHVRFIARLELTRSLLEPGGASVRSESEMGALHILATGALAEAYDADFRHPALRVLNDDWHSNLASRLRWQVVRMCREAGE